MQVEYKHTVLCKGGLLTACFNPDVVQTECVGLFSGFEENMERGLVYLVKSFAALAVITS